MFSRIIKGLYGDISPQEVQKFSLLSLIFFFTIGTYWMLRPLKDGIFSQIVGIDQQPNAKILSVVVILFMVLIYSKLVDKYEKHQLFYIIGGFYTVVFLLITFFLGHGTIGLPNDLVNSNRMFGWITYFSIESFGSLIVALFWSFVASITDAKSAKRGFSLIIGGAQIGSIAGTYASSFARTEGLMQFFFLMAAFGVVAIMLMIRYFMAVIPKSELVGNVTSSKKQKAKGKTGFLEGIRLIMTKPYIFGIFVVATLYEVIATIIDFQMKKMATGIYGKGPGLTQFLAYFGLATNTLALVMALLGTSYLMRRFGLTFCLLTFPAVLGSAVTYLYYVARFTTPSPEELLWLTFGVMIVAKGLSYALNNPSKEMMYIPTSKDVKYKAKSWIDMFGNRAAKATGATVNNALLGAVATTPALMLQSGAVISLAIIVIWVFAATNVGRTFNKLTKEGKIVE